MGWAKDGSGLDVKRIRSKTLPQIAIPIQSLRPIRSQRKAKRFRAAPVGFVEFQRGRWQRAREKRRDRRVKRQAKAVARRMIVVMLRHQSSVGANRRVRRRAERTWLERVAPDLYGVTFRVGETSGTIRQRCRDAMIGGPERSARAVGVPPEWDMCAIRMTDPNGDVQEFTIGAGGISRGGGGRWLGS